MVLRGQFLERPALVDAGGVTLEALYHRGERAPPLLICPVPGEWGGMNAPPIAEMAWACARAGHPSLRFQHRGEGASQGVVDPARRVDDAEAARRHLCQTSGWPRAAVAGLGAGCATALGLLRARPEMGRAVLVAPEVAPALDVRARILVVLPDLAPVPWRAEVEAELAGRGGRLEIVPGADRRFHRGLTEVGRLAAAWIGDAQ